MAVYFTADLHLGHNSILASCGRPFENISDMNRELIRNWNARVTNDDHVYIVGDVFYGGRRAAGMNEAIETVNKLNGVLHLIAGNHDLPYLKNIGYHYLFADVDHLRYLNHDGKDIFLCHYPLAEWSGYFRESWHIYGHIHNHKNDAFLYMRQKENALNAGVDICGFMPVTFSELIKYNEVWKGQLL